MSTVVAAVLICKLSIRRFGGLKNFQCCPESGMSVVLGVREVGKSIAVALLLSPSNAAVVSDSDHWYTPSYRGFESYRFVRSVIGML
jgi:putative ATP-dependent endonuclease of OLD family